MIAKMHSCERSDQFVKRSRDLESLGHYMEHMKLNSDNSKMGWPPSFSIASLGQQKTHGQLTAANEISSVYLYLFVCFLETIQMSYLYPFALMYILY